MILARKIADNVESYFDFLENALMGYAGMFQTTRPNERDHRCFPQKGLPGISVSVCCGITRYNSKGVGVQSYSASANPPPTGSLALPAEFLKWAQAPAHRGRLYLSKTFVIPTPPGKGGG